MFDVKSNSNISYHGKPGMWEFINSNLNYPVFNI